MQVYVAYAMDIGSCIYIHTYVHISIYTDLSNLHLCINTYIYTHIYIYISIMDLT